MLPVITPPTPGGGTPPGFSPPVFIPSVASSGDRFSCRTCSCRLAFDLLNKMVCLACWAWNPKTVHHPPRKLDSTSERNAVTLRNVDRLGGLSRAQNRRNSLPLVDEWGPRPCLRTWLFRRAHQNRFGATDRR